MEQFESRAYGKLIDLSHTVQHGQVTYEGLPAPSINDYLSREASREHYSPGTEFHIGKIEMVASTGTYVDAPFHRFADGLDVSELPLSSLANLEGIVIRANPDQGRAVDVSAFEGKDLVGKAVLVHTGWSVHWGTAQYFESHPFLTEDAAQYLSDSSVALVGIDSLNVDDTRDGRRPVHTTLLGERVPLVEHLTNLDKLPDQGFRFFAVPTKVKGLGSFPVRAFGLVSHRRQGQCKWNST